MAHGSDDSTISIVSFTYASDTSMAVKLSADHGVKYIRVLDLNDNYYLSKRHPFIFIQESFGIVHPLGTTILNPYSLW